MGAYCSQVAKDRVNAAVAQSAFVRRRCPPTSMVRAPGIVLGMILGFAASPPPDAVASCSLRCWCAEDRFGERSRPPDGSVLVASYNEDTGAAASIYDLETGVPVSTLQAPDVQSENDGFGYRVASTDRLLAVARASPPAIFLYDRHARLLRATHLPEPPPGSPCGWLNSLAMRGRRIVAGTECGILVVDARGEQRTIGNVASGAIALAVAA
jgi:hypothetical protein